MNANVFKSDDIVRCVNARGTLGLLTVGATYMVRDATKDTVRFTDGDLAMVDGVGFRLLYGGWWGAARFELVSRPSHRPPAEARAGAWMADPEVKRALRDNHQGTREIKDCRGPQASDIARPTDQ